MYDPYTPRTDWSGIRDDTVQREPSSFCCVGRIEIGKGQNIVLQAIQSLMQSSTNTQTRFVGTVPSGSTFDTELKELAGQFDITSQIEWLGFKEDVTTEIAGCVALICASRQESLGRVILEAWDAGLIPIAWKGSGGPAEVITASGGGILFEQHDGDSLAETMLQVMRMPVEERMQMVEKGREWVRVHCDPERYSSGLFELFSEALNGGGH